MTDGELLAKCLYGEARGEGYCGMMAVGLVIWNRHIAWKQTLEQVILGKNQFTSMDGAGPQIPENDPQYADALSIAGQILTGKAADITNGACWYYNAKIATSKWFLDSIVNSPMAHPMVAKIKSHTFFR